MLAPTLAVPPYRALSADYDSALGLRFFRRVRAAFERLQEEYDFTFRSAADGLVCALPGARMAGAGLRGGPFVTIMRPGEKKIT